ncbi:MAG: lipoprotein releasing system, ATP-binding protein [Frankiales bacterium]|nr:lipoprotein releasing system, ATP-binding protein [Frankiales bacterium]
MTVARATGVVVAYEGRRVLDALTLAVELGEQIAVTGRSGSGKTTLLLVLSGLLPPTAGTVELGVPLRDVLYVPQAPSLVPELSALDNAALGLRLRGTPPREALSRACEELTLLGLADALEALPSELSGGMQQRVALARATVVEPRLLLTDEPTGTLDRHNGDHVLQVLRDLAARSGAALVIATHDPEVAARMPRQVQLSDGRTTEVAA